jgi:fatty acid desaturase
VVLLATLRGLGGSARRRRDWTGPLRGFWLQLLIAGALEVIFTQFAFLGHEASHRQVLTSRPANDRIGRMLATALVGISYSWWMSKHTRHHANPNKIGKDPDIEIDTVSFLEEDAASRRGVMAWITRRQGYLFFPLLLLEGVNLHLTSIRGLFARRRVEGRWLELSVLSARFGCYLAVLFWLLPLGMAFAFLGVQLAVFGLYMGASFAPKPCRHADRPARRKAGLLEQAGTHLTQRRWRLVGHGADGRTQLPDRTPPVPEHAATTPEQGASACAGALPVERRAVHRNVPAHRLGHRGPLSQSGRSRRS